MSPGLALIHTAVRGICDGNHRTEESHLAFVLARCDHRSGGGPGDYQVNCIRRTYAPNILLPDLVPLSNGRS